MEGNVLDWSTLDYKQPLKTTKYNIGIKEDPKMDIVGDYWDQEMVPQVVELLCEYKCIFLYIFSKIKGIISSLV